MKKLFIIGGFSALFIYLAIQVKKMADEFSFKILGYGLPKVQGSVITLPVRVQFFNPYPITLPVQRFEANIFINQGNQWQQVSRIDQPFTIEKGNSDHTINATIDLAATFNNVLQTAKTFLLGELQVRTDVTITIANVPFKQQPFTESVKLPQIPLI